uniref:CBFA2/RUNX1 partner transcriptional co-repressor 3 n=1 Tax=Taeniopygia guttata TaxID=59729 RepID=A0A674GYH8_TAEGU
MVDGLSFDEWEQPLTDRHQRGSVHPQRVQQWASHLLQRLPIHPPAPSGLRCPPALQAQALPHHPAAVRERHLPRDRGAGAHPRPGARELHPHHRGVPRQAPRGHQLPAATLRHPLPQGQPAAAAAGAAALRSHGQADPGPVPGAARAAAAGRQRLLSHRLLRAAPGGGRERQEEDARQDQRERFGPRPPAPRAPQQAAVHHEPRAALQPQQRAEPPPERAGAPPGRPPLPQHYRLEDMAMAHHYRDTYRHPDPRELRERQRPAAVHGTRQEEVIDHRLTDREWAEEWKHLNNLLNCIMDMVEKTRRSLTVLRRCQEADREELNHWIRRYSDAEDMKKGSPPSARPHNSSSAATEAPQLDAHRDFAPRPLSGYMPEEIWRKAEEAVNEVKRQAMSELQKAVSDAERKAHELITTERAKMERALAEAKRQASEDALTVINQQEDSSESCWNCGRKASETCSGCNTARYCGSFCQHKDWEKHHHVCGQTLQGLPGPAAPGPGQPDAVPAVASSPSEAGSVAASRAATPATPAPLDSASR